MELLIGLLTAVILLAGSIITLLVALVRRDVREVHVMVNSRMDEAMDRIEEQNAAAKDAEVRIDQLIQALTAAGVDSPAKPGRSYTNSVDNPERGEP